MKRNIIKKAISLFLAILIASSCLTLVSFSYEDLYIDYQGASDVRDIPWGLKGNTHDNGCGWISIYNIILSQTSRGVTKEQLIEEVKGDLEKIGAPFFMGLLGTNPFKMTQYLKEKFKVAEMSSLFNRHKWNDYANGADGIIVLLYSGGTFLVCHYVAGINSLEVDENGNKLFTFYNTSDADPDENISITEYLNRTKKDGDIPLLMIYVREKHDKNLQSIHGF